jgi:hypothetical protein
MVHAIPQSRSSKTRKVETMNAKHHDPLWREKTDARGHYRRDDAIVVDGKGLQIGATFASMREALRSAARIPGASAHRIGG